MRISDWSSDVCSSDLPEQRAPPALQRRYVGIVVGGDALQVAAVGDQPRRDVAFFAVVLEQNLEEIRQRPQPGRQPLRLRSEEHTSELQSLMRISYAVFCLKKKKTHNTKTTTSSHISLTHTQAIHINKI